MTPKKPSPPSLFDPTSYAPDFKAPLFNAHAYAVEPPSFPSFPTVDEVLNHEKVPHPLLLLDTPAATRPDPSLFQGLLNGNLEHLSADMAHAPGRYSTETLQLVEQLRGQRLDKLTRAERALLDEAVIQYAGPGQAPPTTRTAPVVTKESAPSHAQEEPPMDAEPQSAHEESGEEAEGVAPGDVPEGSEPWWQD